MRGRLRWIDAGPVATISPVTIRRAYVDAGGGQVHLRSTPPVPGRRPLVCLHATAYSSATFVPLLGAGAAVRQIVAIDAPGYGESDRPAAPLDMAGYAAAIGEAIDGWCGGPVDLLGYHTGAYMAAELAIARPALVARLTLIGVPYFQALDLAAWRQRLTAPHRLGDTLDQFAERWDYLVANRPAGLSLARAFGNFVDELRAWPDGAAAHRAMFDWDADRLLPTLGQPVLVINPAGHLAEASRAAARLIAQATVHEMPDLSGAIFDRSPERLVAAIEAAAGARQAAAATA